MRLLVVALVLASCAIAAQATTTGCKTNAKVLVYGQLTSYGNIDYNNGWAKWLQTALPSSTVSWDNAGSPITSTSWSNYDLVITAYLANRAQISSTEAANIKAFVDAGGALIALAGFTNDQNDIDRQQAVLSAWGITFGPVNALTTITPGQMVYNPANPLTAGLSGKWISYAGGWPSTPYANGVLFAQQGNPATESWSTSKNSVGQTITLANGGKIVAWGDEWATFLNEYSGTNNGNEIFWKNAVSWVSGICTAPTSATCGNVFRANPNCASVTHSVAGKGYTLSFSDTVSNCN